MNEYITKICNKCNRLLNANQFYKNKYGKIRYHTDINYKLKTNLRNRLNEAINNKHKSARTMELLGCTIEELKQHLESLFGPGMNWENHSQFGWHIDHINPCASFDLSDAKQQKECFHYTNLQPLWWYDNLAKSDKLLEEI